MIPQGYPKVKKEFLTFSKFLLSGCCLLLVAAASSLPHFILVVTTAAPPFIPQAAFCTSFRKDLLKVWELQGELVHCRHRQWQPTPALLPRKSHGWRSLVGPSPWGRKESDTTERLLTFTFTSTGQKI